MSRWMMPFWWACWIAWQTGRNSSSRSRRRQPVLVAIGGDRRALDQLHHEVRPAALRGAAVEDLGDVGVVHEGQGLPLGLEAGDHLAGVHARLDDLERDLALHGLSLLGHPDLAHAAFADPFQQLVAAGNQGSRRGLGGRGGVVRWLDRGRLHRVVRWLAQEVASPSVGPEQGLDPLAEGRVAGAGLVQVRGSLLIRPAVQGSGEDGHQVPLSVVHGASSVIVYLTVPRLGQTLANFSENRLGRRVSRGRGRRRARPERTPRTGRLSAGESPRAAAASWRLRPAKNLSFTSSAACGWDWASRSRASSRSRRSDVGCGRRVRKGLEVDPVTAAAPLQPVLVVGPC